LDRKKKFETSNTEDNDEIRPTDVPGRMLNMALLNMGSEDYNLRLSAYSLLCALSISFRFGVSTSVIHSKDVFIPYNDMDFIVNISENIAASETHLTLEFLNECILGFDRSNIECTKHILTLEYMVPWLKNIPLYIYGPNGKDVHKVRELIRSLINLTAEKQEVRISITCWIYISLTFLLFFFFFYKLYEQIQRKIWKTLGEIEEIHNIILDCLIQYSVEHGLGSHHAEVVSNTLVTMNCISIRAKIIIKLRKCLSSTSQNCRSTLVKHPVWNEIACLVRAMVAVSFFYASLSESFLAECFHVVALLASTGPTLIRSSIHGLVVNAIHMLITSECITVCNRKKLKYLMNDVGDGKYRVHFGLNKSYANAFTITEETMSDNMENINLASLEIIVQLLLEVTSSAAPNAGKISI
jgi:neurofibromin 1